MADLYDQQFRQRISMHLCVCDAVSAEIIGRLCRYLEQAETNWKAGAGCIIYDPRPRLGPDGLPADDDIRSYVGAGEIGSAAGVDIVEGRTMKEIKIAVAAQRLLIAAQRMEESLPIYSESSAAFTRHQELVEAMQKMKKVLEEK